MDVTSSFRKKQTDVTFLRILEIFLCGRDRYNLIEEGWKQPDCILPFSRTPALRPSSFDINIIPEWERERGGGRSVALHSVCTTNYSGCRDAVVCAPLCCCARPVWPLMFAIPTECANTTTATFRFNTSTVHPLKCHYLAASQKTFRPRISDVSGRSFAPNTKYEIRPLSSKVQSRPLNAILSVQNSWYQPPVPAITIDMRSCWF